MENNTVNQLTWWGRLKAPMPKFFKKLSYLGGMLVALTAPMASSVVPVSQRFADLCLYVNIIGLTMISVAQFAVDEESKK